jgi:peptidoglycan/xylan/chitin deacetylase (PgdA/CDA1 family)
MRPGDRRGGAGKDAEIPRLSTYREAWRLLLDLDTEERWGILEEIGAHVVASPDYPDARRLNADEISQLHDSGLVEIGAHTMNHPFLPALSDSEQQAEIVASKQVLEQLIGEQVNCFAYPFGAFSTRTPEIVSRAGYACACTTIPSAAWRHSDLYRLPRVPVEDCDGDQFERRLFDAFTRREVQ